MFCMRCGKDIPDGSKVCPSCGAQLPDVPAAPQPAADQEERKAKARKKTRHDMLKLIGWVGVAILIIAILASILKGPKKPVPDAGSNPQAATQATQATQAPEPTEQEPYVILDNEYVRLTTTGLYGELYSDTKFSLQVRAENKSAGIIKIRVDNASVNDEMVHLFCGLPEITAGKAANDELWGSFRDLTTKRVEDIREISMTLIVYNDDYKTLTEEQVTLQFR